MNIQSIIRAGLGMLVATAALTVGGVAHARSDIGFSIGISSPGVVVGGGSGGYYAPSQPYYAPAPSYYAPAPTYYSPPPTYYSPPVQIYQAPRPIVYAPPVYVGPSQGYYRGDRDGYRHREWERARWERDHHGGGGWNR